MRAFLLILSILGQPEQGAAVCETYKQCSDEGAEMQAEYVRQFDRMPRDFSYRVVPVIIARDGSKQ